MRTLWGVIGVLAVVGVLGASAFSPRVQAASSVDEVEPNDTCASAQVLRLQSFPLTISGVLDGTSYPDPGGGESTTPNIDFFRIETSPASLLKIDMGGESSGQGSLPDPMLGIFDSNCGQLGSADYGGPGLDAELIAQAPEDGVVVIAATSCCDYSFTRGGYSNGSYTLTIDAQPTIGSVSGRLVDADTGQPLTAGANNASANLQFCPGDELSSCYPVAWIAPDDQGAFLVTPQSAFNPLLAGQYYLYAAADGYRPLQTARFSVGAAEDYLLGDLALSTPKQIPSIDGRVVDSRTGAPIAFVSVYLDRCSPGDEYCYPVNQTSSDTDGSFSFSSDMVGNPLYDDTYQVSLAISGYDGLWTPQFTPIAGQSYNLGDLQLRKIPLIGSISGRLLDAVTGEPLTNLSVTYAHLSLLACDMSGCYNTVAWKWIEPDGSFRFDATDAWQPLVAGSYAISYQAEQYIDGQSDMFTVAEGEDYSIDLHIQPYPIRLLNGASCTTIPAGGGTCKYSLRLVNNQNKTVSLRAWSIAEVSIPNSYDHNTFQPKDAQKVKLRPGESTLVSFSFDVPRNVAAFTSVCTQYYVSDDVKGFYLAPTTQRFGFCVTKDGAGDFKPTTGDALRELLQRMHGVPLDRRGRR